MKKISFKQFFIIILIFTIIINAIIALLLFYSDPYYQYSVPNDDQIYLYDESFQNPGMLKNYNYDTLIIGSSMTENFRKSWFDEMFSCNSYKASFRGAWSTEMSTAMQLAFENHDIKNVFIGLDISMLINDPNRPKYELPEYLYDDVYINDLKYLLNKTALLEGIPLAKREGNLDKAFAWGYKKNMVFSKQTVIENFESTRTVKVKGKELSETAYHEIMLENIKNFTNHIANHEDTTFYIFLPPYSILYWYDNDLKGMTNAQLNMVDEALNMLMEYKNVKVFYFQNEDFILNLDNYKDITHYSPNINYYIVESIAAGNNQVSKETLSKEINKLREMIGDFNYEDYLKN